MVRCLTRRFLPEYATGCDECHTYQTTIDDATVRMEIIDCSKNVSTITGAMTFKCKPNNAIGPIAWSASCIHAAV